ncbi:hypothetical protein D0T49_03670 [Paludibacter sp. 221]|nr:hypothetical protein [Paludibacter sp. 221]
MLTIGCLLAGLLAFPYFNKGKLVHKIIFGVFTVSMVVFGIYIFKYFGIIDKWYIRLFAPSVIVFISNFMIHMMLFFVSSEYRNEIEKK